MRDPAKASNDKTLTNEQSGALAIAKQTLRLYPSTRHTSRVMQLEGDTAPKLQTVDVQATQRANCVFGDAFTTEKDQDRHLEGEPNSSKFLAFGVRKFKCPAASDYGVRMVALLVAAML